MSLLARLKGATATHHAALEATLNVLSPALSFAGYTALLDRMYGYYSPLEAHLAEDDWWEQQGLALQPRLKTPALEADLRWLRGDNSDLAQLPRCNERPAAGRAHMLGYLYVLEGATLGGQIISRHLQLRWGLTAAAGSAFFSGYGPQTGQMWRQFGAFAEQIAPLLDGDGAVAGACCCFARLSEWLHTAPKANLFLGKAPSI